MTGRERVNLALTHKEPDKIPISIGSHCCDGFTIEALQTFGEYMNTDYGNMPLSSKMMGSVYTPDALLKSFESDFRTITPQKPYNDKTVQLQDGGYIDEYGCTFAACKYYYDIVKRPLAGTITVEDIEKSSWPDPNDKGRYAGLMQEAQNLRSTTDYAIVAEMICCGPFEQACWVRGFDDFLCDLYADPYMAEALMDKITQINLQFYDNYLEEVGEYIDVFCQGDDLAIQNSSFMSPEIYHKYILKYHKQMYDLVKRKSSAKIMHHCCGSAYGLLPGLIEAGIDILNPVQVSALNMEPERLKKEFGRDICFWGGIDVQHLLPNGTVDEVKEAAMHVMEVLGKDGGYVFAPSHNLQPLIPPENIKAMYDTALLHRDY